GPGGHHAQAPAMCSGSEPRIGHAMQGRCFCQSD
ncbi:unnamed protein product, partial [Allacma fusca]